ncbi:MAG TPA: hypothetical protein VGN72_10710 [Tepidisphaeraceae bacterium]|jgi:hypothetical protein|nr:hypothetical protein [Tepidisphaeraceae bacterium]
MEAISIVQSTADLVFEVAQWPRAAWSTFWRAVFKPWAIWRQVDHEFRYPDQARADNTMPALLFWVLVVVVPFFMFADHWLGPAAVRYPWLEPIASQPWPVRLFAVAFFLAAGPMKCARTILKASPRPHGKDALKRLFAIECVVLAPAYYALMLILLLGVAGMQSGQNTVITVCALISIYAQWPLVRAELGANRMDTFLTVMTCFGRWWGQVILMILVFGTLFMLAKGIPDEVLRGATTLPSGR